MRRSLPPKRFRSGPSSANRTGWCLGRSYHGGSKPNIRHHGLYKEIEDRELQGNFQVGKAFTAMFDPNGHYAFHIMTPRDERKETPRPLRSDELFQMPDVVLDLDAWGARNVRATDNEDETAMAEVWALTGHQRQIRSRLKDLRHMIGEARETQRKVMSSSTNPWRITSHDVLSTALRGLKPPEGANEDTIAGEFGSLRISQLTYATPDQECQMKRYQSSHQRQPSEQQGPATSDRIDPRRTPDFLEEVRMHNGIPSHATHNNELLLRWVMSRRDMHRFNIIKTQQSKPSALQVASDLQTQSSIDGIRRVVFHSIALKADLNSYSSGAGRGVNVAKEIRDACVRVINASPGLQVCYETLEFVNNLSYRVLHPSKNLEACVVALRLRCLARLGQLDLTAIQLQSNFAPELLNSELNILPDVRASLESWRMVVKETKGLGHKSRRQLLFTILTGLGEANLTTVGASFRSLLFACGYPATSFHREERQQAYEEYILLLAHLGALRTIWKEWRTYTSELFHGTDLISPTAYLYSDGEEGPPNLFSRALSIAVSIPDPEYFERRGNSEPDLAQCQKMDYEWIKKGMAEQQAYFPQATKTLSMHELQAIMELPLNDSLEAMERHRRALHTEQ